ncbi:hypothetical protein RCOM_1445290 [Ricinus communis]|uniref:J domain-containing protein n=1 Tax=Ricinus communis TaxID=3988 RepID=B9RGY4_RICCO|nr:hypothetical protein RCOM_1445290 [Ricinus communis]
MDQKKMFQALQDCYLPPFDDIAGMIAVCDILHSAGYGFLGCDTDYYWILEVSPSATEFAIKIQNNKLVTLLDPIKDNFPCAASALKITHDAFSVLANPKKRSMFDMKRAIRLQSYGSENLQEVHVVDSPKEYLQAVKWQESEVRYTRFPCDMLNAINVKGTNEHSGGNWAQEASDGSANFQQEIDGFSAKFPWDVTSTSSDDHDRHNFVTRTEEFAIGQVWAAHDDEGMPRNYARIVKIKVHESPCRMYISWLKPVPDTVHGKKWCEAGLPLVCGLFDVDRGQTTLVEPTSFSHRMSPDEWAG